MLTAGWLMQLHLLSPESGVEVTFFFRMSTGSGAKKRPIPRKRKAPGRLAERAECGAENERLSAEIL
jgi:hypothetical protein